MLLLALVVGMIAYVIVRLQMINLELSWLRQYVMRLLTREVESVGSTSKSDDEIDEVRSVDEEERGCPWNGDPGQCSIDGMLEDAVGVGAVLANPTAFVVVQESGPPNADHEERITEIDEPQQSVAFDDQSETGGNDGTDSRLQERVEHEYFSDGEDDTKVESSKEPTEPRESLLSEEYPVEEDAAATRSETSRSSRRKSKSSRR